MFFYLQGRLYAAIHIGYDDNDFSCHEIVNTRCFELLIYMRYL